MPSLLEQTKQLARRCDLGPDEMARRAGVGYEWLRKFKAGDIKNPGIIQVERLHDFLTLYQAAKKNGADTAAIGEQRPA